MLVFLRVLMFQGVRLRELLLAVFVSFYCFHDLLRPGSTDSDWAPPDPPRRPPSRSERPARSRPRAYPESQTHNLSFSDYGPKETTMSFTLIHA